MSLFDCFCRFISIYLFRLRFCQNWLSTSIMSSIFFLFFIRSSNLWFSCWPFSFHPPLNEYIWCESVPNGGIIFLFYCLFAVRCSFSFSCFFESALDIFAIRFILNIALREYHCSCIFVRFAISFGCWLIMFLLRHIIGDINIDEVWRVQHLRYIIAILNLKQLFNELNKLLWSIF